MKQDIYELTRAIGRHFDGSNEPVLLAGGTLLTKETASRYLLPLWAALNSDVAAEREAAQLAQQIADDTYYEAERILREEAGQC